MSAIDRYGDGDDCEFFPLLAVADVLPHVSRIIDLRRVIGVSLQLITTGALTGAWLIEISNDYVPAGSNVYGAIPGAGTWTVVPAGSTGSFTPAPAAVVGPSNQFAQSSQLMARALRITFTGASDTGTVRVIGFAKSFG